MASSPAVSPTVPQLPGHSTAQFESGGGVASGGSRSDEHVLQRASRKVAEAGGLVVGDVEAESADSAADHLYESAYSSHPGIVLLDQSFSHLMLLENIILTSAYDPRGMGRKKSDLSVSRRKINNIFGLCILFQGWFLLGRERYLSPQKINNLLWTYTKIPVKKTIINFIGLIYIFLIFKVFSGSHRHGGPAGPHAPPPPPSYHLNGGYHPLNDGGPRDLYVGGDSGDEDEVAGMVGEFEADGPPGPPPPIYPSNRRRVDMGFPGKFLFQTNKQSIKTAKIGSLVIAALSLKRLI